MKKIMMAAAIVALTASSALATQCRDSSGKFIKCPAAKVVHCRDSAGKFVKCSAPGATPG